MHVFMVMYSIKLYIATHVRESLGDIASCIVYVTL